MRPSVAVNKCHVLIDDDHTVSLDANNRYRFVCPFEGGAPDHAGHLGEKSFTYLIAASEQVYQQPKTITFGLRDDRMLTPNQTRWQTRHKQTGFPMTGTLTVDYITKFGERLLKEFMEERTGKWRISIMSLSFSGLERVEKGQKGIQGFFGNGGISVEAASARCSPAPVSEKSLGKRKASEEVVDLTLDGGTSDVEPLPAHTAKAGDSSSSDSDFMEVAPEGPFYKCPKCAGFVPVAMIGDESLAKATERVQAAHLAMHAKRVKHRDKVRTKDRGKVVKKRRGQQRLPFKKVTPIL